MKKKLHVNRAGKALLLIMMMVIFVAATAQSGTIEIPKGTKAKMEFPADIKITSGNVTQGIPIICYLAESIEVGGIIVIEEGAQGTATVVEAVPAGKGGKPGRIKIAFTSLDAKGEYQPLTGTQIKLTGACEAKGKGKKLLSYLLIFGLFIKGSEAVISTNTIYTAEVAESIILQSK